MLTIPEALNALRKARFSIEPVNENGTLIYRVNGAKLSAQQVTELAEVVKLGAEKYGSLNWKRDHES